MLRKASLLLALLGVAMLAGAVQGADLTGSLKKGTPDLKSAGPLAFGPEGILFIGDTQGAAIFAINTGDRAASSPTSPLKVVGIDTKVAALLGTKPEEIMITDLAVNPASGNAYLSVMRGKSADALPVILKVDRQGQISEVSLKDIPFSKVTLPNPVAEGRTRRDVITDIGYVEGRVVVAGLSNEEFASKLRTIPFPFSEADKGTSVEIYHGAHGAIETRSPVRTFATYEIKGQSHVLAAYTCTPLVKFPVSDLKPGVKVSGTTVAELGNRNQPLDMVVYQKGGKDYVLLTNSSRGVMKITTENIDKIEGITKRIADKAGLPYETIDSLKDVQQMDRLDKDHVLLLKREAGTLNLETVPLP